MPFKSQAQRRKFYQMAEEKEISRKTLREWENATGSKKLPERVRPKKYGETRKRTSKEPRYTGR